MTEQPTFVTFEADLPDDAEFSPAGDIVIPAGRAISEVLTHALELQGFNVHKWDQHEFYGWQTTVELNGQRCWMLLQGGEPWLLILERKNGLFSCIQKAEGAFHQILTVIDAALRDNEHVDSVSWFTRAQYEKQDQLGKSVP